MPTRGGVADLVLGNNVLAQVPDINDFVAGVKALLAEGGTATFEFPHLATLIEHLEYDTIYHEHFSYFSLLAIREIFGAQGLAVVDVEEIPTHGGSLRVFLGHAEEEPSCRRPSPLSSSARTRRGCATPRPTRASRPASRVEARAARAPDRPARGEGKQVVGYGAPGKGNTLLNYCGIRTDFLDYTVDRNPYKQGSTRPGHTSRSIRRSGSPRRDPT